jgi:putative colanic acid biosynthesis UDP-glucose lipid carrier transferase
MLKRGLLKEHAKLLSWIAKLADTLLFLAAGIFAFYLQFDQLHLGLLYFGALLIGVLLVIPVFSFFDIYESLRAKNLIKFFARLYVALFALMLFLAAAGFITKTGIYFSRAWFVYWGLSAVILITLFRVALMLFLRAMRKRGWNQRQILIIGAGQVSHGLVKEVKDADWSGLKIVKVLSLQDLPKNLGLYIENLRVDEVWVALSLQEEKTLKNIVHELRHNVVTIRYFPDMFGADLLRYTTDELFGFFAVNIVTSPMVGINRAVKWLEDKVIAAIILLLVSPLMLLIALVIKLTSPGSVFYCQLRHGWDGKPIRIYKFRSMYEHQEQSGKVTQAQKNDKRITPIGKILRATSLDEFPQFINVLQGKMSIVGPRPHAIEHNEHYKKLITSYMQRHHVKPGITGWAQINGWRGETDTLDKMEKRVEYDLYYIEHWSLWFDLKIIFLTIFKGFANKNAY